MKDKEVKKAVREGYAKVVKENSSCCAPEETCCGSTDQAEISRGIGYSEEELKSVPEGANLGLGCGNPTALASLKEGETVLDLGSGAGFDSFLAAKKVGEKGKVIGVDMTPEMIAKANQNAKKGGYQNVEFRLGEIEKVPVDDGSVDVIISNCVINLSPDKRSVFQEAFRALKPGGRIMISDIVLTKELPDFVKDNIEAYVGCVSGAAMKQEYQGFIKEAGFSDVEVVGETSFPTKNILDDPLARTIIENSRISPEKAKEIAGSILSIKVSAVKPKT